MRGGDLEHPGYGFASLIHVDWSWVGIEPVGLGDARVFENSKTDGERRNDSVSDLFDSLTPGAFLYIDLLAAFSPGQGSHGAINGETQRDVGEDEVDRWASSRTLLLPRDTLPRQPKAHRPTPTPNPVATGSSNARSSAPCEKHQRPLEPIGER